MNTRAHQQLPTQGRSEHDWRDPRGLLPEAVNGGSFGLIDLLRLLRRRLRLVLGVLAVVVGATMLYSFLETPRYVATATILLDSSKGRPNEEIASLSAAGADQTIADSQVEVLKSGTVANAVIDKLKLDEDPYFYAPKSLIKRAVSSVSAILTNCLRLLGIARELPSSRNLSLEAMKDYLTVERVGATYAITLGYGYPDARKSAEIVNAYIEAYQTLQVEARDNQSGRTTTWLRTRLDELRQQSLTADFEMQRLRQENPRTDSDAGNRTLVRLRDLERESETYKRLYQTFLSRYQQVIEQGVLSINEARVVTFARPPIEPAYPRKALFLPVSLFLGAGIGIGFALVLELLSRSVRSRRDVTEGIGLPYLGLLPRPENGADAIESQTPFDYVRREPNSIYSETLKSIWVRALRTSPPGHTKVIGFCSVVPNEGKSVVASNFALSLASSKTPTIVIDANRQSRTLTDIFGTTSVRIVDQLQGSDSLTETGLCLLSLWSGEDPAKQPVTESFRRLDNLLSNMNTAVECVVLDLPPLGLVEPEVLAPLVDHFVLVVEWGQLSPQSVRTAVENHDSVREKCLGVVLNGVDLTKFSLFDQDGTAETMDQLAQVYFTDRHIGRHSWISNSLMRRRNRRNEQLRHSVPPVKADNPSDIF